MPNPFKGVQIEFQDQSEVPYFTPFNSTITLKYPQSCTNLECFPYKITLQRGVYQFECWGAKGAVYSSTHPGLGAYTSGIIKINAEKTFFIYIGATGFFNAVKRTSSSSNSPQGGGGSTDVRLSSSANWYDEESLYTRIMVAAGGGSAEWANSQGGHAGALIGGTSISATNQGENSPVYDDQCPGATQEGSQDCQPIVFSGITYPAYKGGFGYAGNPPTNSDEGGFGGNGYYGGTTYPYAFAGSGGSSFISGHNGCKAIENPEISGSIVHKEDSIHYSGIYFQKTEMIAGNELMPHPNGGQRIWDEENGAFRLTYMYPLLTCKKSDQISLSFILASITSFIRNK